MGDGHDCKRLRPRGFSPRRHGLPRPRARVALPHDKRYPNANWPRARRSELRLARLPQGAVDSERIIMRLRAEGYELAASTGAPTSCWLYLGFLDSAKANRSRLIGRRSAKRQGDRDRLHGREPRRSPRATRTCWRSPAAAIRERVEAVIARCRRGTSVSRPGAARGIKLTPRTMRISRFRGCNNRAASASSRGCAATWSRARLPTCGARRALVGLRQGALGDLAGHLRLRGRHQICREHVGGPEVRAKFLDLAGAAGELGVWVRLHYVLSLTACGRGIPLMAEGRGCPYLDIPFQHASRTC